MKFRELVLTIPITPREARLPELEEMDIDALHAYAQELLNAAQVLYSTCDDVLSVARRRMDPLGMLFGASPLTSPSDKKGTIQ